MGGKGRSQARGTKARLDALLIGAALTLFPAPAFARAPSIAFFYGTPLPTAALGRFERVVVEPDHATARELADLTRRGAEVYAYLSLGELNPSRPYAARVRPEWALATNEAWGSRIVDPAQPQWQALLLEEAARLMRAGYRGLFLDTLDSYRAVRASAEQLETRRRAMAQLILSLHARFPKAKLLLNRGFEVLPEVAGAASAMVAESLFCRVGTGPASYAEVPEADRAWLVAKLREAEERYGLPSVVIDYLPPGQRERARAIAGRIAALGFTPYVADRALTTVGVGAAPESSPAKTGPPPR